MILRVDGRPGQATLVHPAGGTPWSPDDTTIGAGTFTREGDEVTFIPGFLPISGWYDGRVALWGPAGARGVAAPQDVFAARRRPSLRGPTWFWFDEGVWWRQRGAAATAVAAGGALAPGPFGAAAWIDGDVVAGWIAPASAVVPLDRPIDVAPWGLRWDASGTLYGLAEGAPVRVGPGGRVVDATRLVAPGWTWDEPDLIAIDRPLDRRFRGTTQPVCSGERLAGPGGVVWDLTTGRQRFSRPVVRGGPTVAGPGPWFTVEADGSGPTWFDPEDGRSSPAALPIDPDDAVLFAVRDGDGVVIGTALGRGWRLAPDASPAPARPPRPPAPPEPHVWNDLWFDGSAIVGGCRWAWRNDGLLVRLPTE